MQGNSSSSRSARASKQLRDSKGRWIEMGSLVKGYLDDKSEFAGNVTGLNDNGTATVQMTTGKYAGYPLDVPAGELETINEKAMLDKNYVPDNLSVYNIKDTAFKSFPGYTKGEEFAIKQYVDDYQSINRPLRSSTDSSVKKSADHQNLMNVLDKSILDAPVTVYRALAADKDLLSKLQKHGVYFDKAFTSTSSTTAKIDKVHSGIVLPDKKIPVSLEINLPKGFKAHKFDYTMNNSNAIARFADEEEVLLPPEVPFRVISLEKHPTSGGYRAVIEPILTKQNSSGVPTEDENAQNAINVSTAEQKKKKWGLFSMSTSELAIGSKLTNSSDTKIAHAKQQLHNKRTLDLTASVWSETDIIAQELAVGTKLVFNNDIVLEKVTEDFWEYQANSTKISYNNRSIDCFKSIDSIVFNVETS